MRFGLIGTGYWAREVHAAGLAQTAEAELVGVWGRDQDKAAVVTERFGGRPYARPEELFDDVDAVAFAVPPDVQAPLAVQAANRGCHLLLEKPIALDAGQADALVEAAEANDVASVVFFTSRFLSEVEDWLTEVCSRDDWTGASAIWLGSIFRPGSPFADSPWRKRWGALWDVGPHALSVVLPVMGAVAEVTAARGPKDTAHLILRHTSGASSSLVVSLTAPEQAVRVSMSVYGEPGWSDMPRRADVEPVERLSEAAQALIRSADTGSTHDVDVRFGGEVVHILARAQAAMG